MALVGYARISTDDGRQTTQRQLDELRAAGCTEVLEGICQISRQWALAAQVPSCAA